MPEDPGAAPPRTLTPPSAPPAAPESAVGGTGGATGPSGTGSSGTGATGSSGAGLYLDPSGLVQPVAIVTGLASDCAAAVTELTVTIVGGMLSMGDPGVEAAWSAFHTAWLSEVQVASSALDEAAKVVPATATALQGADQQSGSEIKKIAGGLTGSVGGLSGASGPGISGGGSSGRSSATGTRAR